MKKLVCIVLLSFSLGAFCQNNYSLKLYGLGVHPFNENNTSILTRTIDKNGKFAFEPGIILAAEYFVNSDMVSVKPMQSFYYDRLGKIAGFTHLGLRAYVYKEKRHALALGIGTSLFYRQTWSGEPNYVDEDIYKTKNDFQYKLFMLSGEIEYSYYLSKLNYFTISLNHIDLQAFTFAVGYKQLFKYKKKKHRSHRRKACDCPSFR